MPTASDSIATAAKLGDRRRTLIVRRIVLSIAGVCRLTHTVHPIPPRVKERVFSQSTTRRALGVTHRAAASLNFDHGRCDETGEPWRRRTLQLVGSIAHRVAWSG